MSEGVTGDGIFRTRGSRTGYTVIALNSVKDGKRHPPGFTADEFYDNPVGQSPSPWYGRILRSIDNFNTLTTKARFDEHKDWSKIGTEPFSTRDYYLIFGDRSTDYFKHGLQIIDEKKMFGETRGAADARIGTPYENSDPVYFGFEVIVDAISSPLLNGAVEDFIEQFSNVSEIASKKRVIQDFKRQFVKLFKTKGTPKYIPNDENTPNLSINPLQDALMPDRPSGQKQRSEAGRKAYFSYYLKKISGLENLVLANNPGTPKYLVDYRKDVLRLTFSEDVSLTLGTLAHLYRLLYWSKPNGKSLIPQNLLRFNCDIIVSECRKFNRVRKAVDSGDIEVIKENLSRHIYQLRECQFYFDKPTHEIELNLESIQDFTGVDVTMDYKYVTTKFERWTPKSNFGQYVSYNAGAMWKVGNKGNRPPRNTEGTPTVFDNSIPRFYQVGKTSVLENYVKAPAVLQEYARRGGPTLREPIKDDPKDDKAAPPAQNNNNNNDGKDDPETPPPPTEKELKRRRYIPFYGDFKDASRSVNNFSLEDFKRAANQQATQFGRNARRSGERFLRSLKTNTELEIKRQLNIRFQLLKRTLDNISNIVSNPPPAGSQFFGEPYNVYFTPYSELKHFTNGEKQWSGSTVDSPSNGWFDIRGSVTNFSGDSLGIELGRDYAESRNVTSGDYDPTTNKNYFTPPNPNFYGNKMGS